MGSWLSTTSDSSIRIADLTGRVAIVTGSSSGIGYATAFELARHGAKVYIAARNESKAVEAIEKMYTEDRKIQTGNLIWLPMDLLDLDHVVQAVKTFIHKEDRLDILVNNAGVATKSFQVTPAGFEVAMGVNHLAHFLLTVSLLPILNRTADNAHSDVRVVNVSSSGHALMIPNAMQFDNLDDLKYHGSSGSPPCNSTRDLFSRYALSKLANILFTTALQKRHQNILCASCNPGGTNTAGGMSVWPVFLRPIMSLLFVPPAVGARPVLLLAAGKDVAADPNRYKAVYIGSKCKIESPSLLARQEQIAENLWKTSYDALAQWIKE